MKTTAALLVTPPLTNQSCILIDWPWVTTLNHFCKLLPIIISRITPWRYYSTLWRALTDKIWLLLLPSLPMSIMLFLKAEGEGEGEGEVSRPQSGTSRNYQWATWHLETRLSPVRNLWGNGANWRSRYSFQNSNSELIEDLGPRATLYFLFIWTKRQGVANLTSVGSNFFVGDRIAS